RRSRHLPFPLAVPLAIHLMAIPAGVAATPDFQINTSTTGYQTQPRVAAGGIGKFVVVWPSLGANVVGGSENSVRPARVRPGARGREVGGEFQVATSASGSAAWPGVAMDAAGNFVVVWHSFAFDGDQTGVVARRYDSSGAPIGGEFQVNTYTTDYQWAPSVAMNASVAFVVAWQSIYQDGYAGGIAARIFGSDGKPLGPDFIVNSGTAHSQDLPSVAVNAAGEFVVTWTDVPVMTPGTFDIFARRFDGAGSP